jgi:hypothetical protein
MPKKPEQEEPNREFHIGDTLKVKLHDGRVLDAEIRALVEDDGTLHLQVDYGHEESW